MNDDPEDTLTENELRRLRPAAVSERLESRIAGLFADETPTRPRTYWWQHLGFARPLAALGWGLVSPVAAVAVTLVMIRPEAREPLPSPRAYDSQQTVPGATRVGPTREVRSARAANVLDGASDEGVGPDGDDGLVRRVRYRSTDHVQWRNPQTGAQWEVSYPREDVLLVPVDAE